MLAARFQSEQTLQRSEIWRRSGLQEEYGGVADGDFYREREQEELIDELTGLLVQAVTREAANRVSREISCVPHVSHRFLVQNKSI